MWLKKLSLTMLTFLFFLTQNVVWSAGKDNETVSKTMVVFDKIASELLQSLNTRSKIAIRPFYKKETGLSESLNSSLINAIVSSLQRKSNYKINLITRDKLKKVWQEVDEFKSTDFDKLVREAGADVLIIGDVRTRKQGLELSFRAYDTADSAKKGKVGKILASTRLHYLKLNWQNEVEFSPEATKNSLNLISNTLKKIQKSFDAISKSGGIIQKPTRPEQFYHNARVQELGGDYINARKSYNRYLSFKLSYLDPHLRYQNFLKLQEGRAGAREVYSDIFQRNNDFVTEFARILLFNPPQRTEMLEKYIAKYPEFSPAFYELSREFSEARKGIQSLADKKMELKFLKKFISLREDGKLIKYFIDKSVISKWNKDTDERLKALSLVADIQKVSPLGMSSMRSSSGWHIRAEISEPVREVFYKLPYMSKFKSMGFSRYKNPTTGLPMANQEQLMPVTPGMVIEFMYIDMTKKKRGPFKVVFDEQKEMNKQCMTLYKTIGFGSRTSSGVQHFPGCENFKAPSDLLVGTDKAAEEKARANFEAQEQKRLDKVRKKVCIQTPGLSEIIGPIGTMCRRLLATRDTSKRTGVGKKPTGAKGTKGGPFNPCSGLASEWHNCVGTLKLSDGKVLSGFWENGVLKNNNFSSASSFAKPHLPNGQYSGDQIREIFSGKTMIYRYKNNIYKTEVMPGGNLEQIKPNGNLIQGKWRIEINRMCSQYDQGEKCFSVYKLEGEKNKYLARYPGGELTLTVERP